MPPLPSYCQYVWFHLHCQITSTIYAEVCSSYELGKACCSPFNHVLKTYNAFFIVHINLSGLGVL